HPQAGDRLCGQLDELLAAPLFAQPGQGSGRFGAEAAMAEVQRLIELADRSLVANQGQRVAERDCERDALRDLSPDVSHRLAFARRLFRELAERADELTEQLDELAADAGGRMLRDELAPS